MGILTGVGFIGGGSVLRRGDLVTGITTAATLLAVTVIGPCSGGGQIWLTIVSTAIGVVTLIVLKRPEIRAAREHRAVFATGTRYLARHRVDRSDRPALHLDFVRIGSRGR